MQPAYGVQGDAALALAALFDEDALFQPPAGRRLQGAKPGRMGDQARTTVISTPAPAALGARASG